MRHREIRMFFGPLLGAALFIVGATAFFLPRIAVTPQKVSDIILHAVSLQNLNKSGEITLFYVLFFMAAIFIGIRYYRARLKWPVEAGKPVSAMEKISWLLFIPMAVYYLMRGQLRQDYVYLFLCLFVLFMYDKKQIYINIALLANSYIASIALIAIKYKYFPDLTSSIRAVRVLISSFAASSPSHLTALLTMTLFIVLFAIKNRCASRKTRYSLLAFPQLLAPFALLIFLVDRYMAGDKLTVLPFDQPYVYAVYFLIAVLFLHSSYHFYKYILREKTPEARHLIFPATLAVFLILPAVAAPHLIIPGDWHHRAENWVPFEQVYYFGKTLYGDFMSASGAYPMVFGFIKDIFLDGTAMSHLQGQTLFTLAAVAVSGFLLYYAFGSEMAFLCALPLWGYTAGYNRVIPVLPFMLILFVPKIVRNRNLWLQVYLLGSLFLALYYPMYGVAYCFGGLPFALMQAYDAIKNRDYGGRVFYITWLICVGIIIYFAPLTINLAKYLLMMASQTTLAHGSALADQLPTSNYLNLFPYILHLPLKGILSHGTLYAYHSTLMLLFLSVLCIYIFNRKKVRPLNPLVILGFTLPLIFVLIASQNPLVTMYWANPFAKIAFVLPIPAMVFAGALWRYGQPLFRPGILLPIIGALMAVSYTFVLGYSPYLSSRLHAFKGVPKGLAVISDDLLAKAPKFGRGLIEPAAIKKYTDYERIFSGITRNDIPISDNGEKADMMLFTLFGKAASYTGLHGLLLSEAMQNAIIDTYKKDRPIVLSVNSVTQYRVYRYLLENYLIINNMFVPREHIPFIKDPKPTPFTALVLGYQRLYSRSNFMGRSFEHLKDRFDIVSANYQPFRQKNAGALIFDIALPEKLGGDEADFIYVKFTPGSSKVLRPASSGTARTSVPQEVTVSWPDANNPDKPHTMLMAYETGEFLIPLGANPYWLTNSHSGFTITVTNPEALAKNVSMEELLFLRLKQ